jgi:hypothetical protein
VDHSLIGWIALGVAVFVYLDLLFVELRRTYREGKRIVTRLIAYGDLPVVRRAAQAGDDVERLTNALEGVSPLLERGRAALTRIRFPNRPAGYDPFVPNGSEASNGLSAEWPSGGSQVQP